MGWVVVFAIFVGFAIPILHDAWTGKERRHRCWCGDFHDCPHDRRP